MPSLSLSHTGQRHPLLYELNTRCWLRELSDKHQSNIQLDAVPDEEFQRWQRLGFTHVWLMGVWQTGKRGRSHSLTQSSLHQHYDEALPGWQDSDVAGSPYAVCDYHVSDALGGDEALAAFRSRLKSHGIKLILDFVPNHTGLDHPWLLDKPELYIHSKRQKPETFCQKTRTDSYWIAHGKDPYFPAWLDTAQLDYRNPETRHVMTAVLQDIAERCDGVRCDMAMLILNEIINRVWSGYPSAQPHPTEEFWSEAIQSIRKGHPDFLFLAEAYWGLEAKLQELGFDYTYDKDLYDPIVRKDAAQIQSHLYAQSNEMLNKSAHFLENHDERRIAASLSVAEHRAAALLILGLPGMRFLHDGQLTGAASFNGVHLCRKQAEPCHEEIAAFYERFLTALPGSSVGIGCGRVLHSLPAWADNPTAQNFVIIQWQSQPNIFDFVVVNFAPHRSQCYVMPDVEGLASHTWKMRDLLGDEYYLRCGAEMQEKGLYLDVAPHGAQLFHFEL